MDDKTATIAELKAIVDQFVQERGWTQFHTPKNLSMDISVEAAELMELFLWVNNEGQSAEVLEKKRQEIEDEAADVLMGLLCFCSICNINLAKAFNAKMQQNKKKYPVDKVHGRAVKYTEIEKFDGGS